MKRYRDAPPLDGSGVILERDAGHAYVAHRYPDGRISVASWHRRDGRLAPGQPRWWASRDEGVLLTAEGARALGRMT